MSWTGCCNSYLCSRAERPEEPIDNRTLYEKLKSQRDKKQEEFEEQFKFSEYNNAKPQTNRYGFLLENMIYKGLDDDEAVFLQLIADKQAKQAAETRNQEKEELQAYRVGMGEQASHHTHVL